MTQNKFGETLCLAAVMSFWLIVKVAQDRTV